MYSLCGLLGNCESLRSLLAGSPAQVIELTGGIGLVPLSESLLAELQRNREAPETPSSFDPFEFLTASVESWVRGLSRGGSLGYVETEYFAGEGYERAALWQNGEITLGPLEGAGAVNRVLKALGVRTSPDRDEFEFVGLGRHRTVTEWLSEA